VIATALLLATSCVAASPPPASEGTIRGIVVNTSRSELPVAENQVFLRRQSGDQFVPVAETTTDQQGMFRFDHLLVDGDGLYLPGANRDGVHYPGPRIPLTSDRPHARVKLLVCDATSGPSPLRISDYSISIAARPGVLTVTEAMSIENPTSLCYVGETPAGNGQPVTLRLAIPPEFERTTFHKEFFGRQFSLAGDKLVTGLPWPPGKRELAFTYVLACSQDGYVWRRPLDLPCRSLHLTVQANDVGGVSANLPPVTASKPGEVCFASTGTLRPAADAIEVTFGHLPIPAMAYGRAIAVITLVGLVAGATAGLWRRARRDART
jgi:hypothetical protein